MGYLHLLLIGIEMGFFGAWVYLFHRLYRYADRQTPQWEGPWPEVSVLVAARNEASNLPRCLDALQQLDYPPDRMTVWVGNDQSEDDTGAIARQYAAVDTRFRAVDIQDNMGKARGKANVLAQLAQQSNGGYIMICDADIRVNKKWIQNMLAWHQHQSLDAVTGTTVGAGYGDLWSELQVGEWLYYMSIFKTLDTMGHSTAMGNNMSITREAYEALGGYESIPFSVTEDYALYRELIRYGYRHQVVYQAGVRNFSAPLPNYLGLLHQKRRWARGAAQLPWRIKRLMILHALFFPALVVHAVWRSPFEALALFGLFVCSTQLVLRFGRRHISCAMSRPARWLFPLHLGIIQLIGPPFALFQPKVLWKGRRYT